MGFLTRSFVRGVARAALTPCPYGKLHADQCWCAEKESGAAARRRRKWLRSPEGKAWTAAQQEQQRADELFAASPKGRAAERRYQEALRAYETGATQYQPRRLLVKEQRQAVADLQARAARMEAGWKREAERMAMEAARKARREAERIARQ